ncbi:hypothetical protein BKA70DRAFT_1233652 [Coprinopsis sp. MPI-PUGE-AT-0042]|nr:hypothetical protein BKA70DRAFT_1233652 [Coprinopsis sp. MPI-PUGE-AT-0042]
MVQWDGWMVLRLSVEELAHERNASHIVDTSIRQVTLPHQFCVILWSRLACSAGGMNGVDISGSGRQNSMPKVQHRLRCTSGHPSLVPIDDFRDWLFLGTWTGPNNLNLCFSPQPVSTPSSSTPLAAIFGSEATTNGFVRQEQARGKH